MASSPNLLELFKGNLIEIWTLYTVGTFMIGARIFVRTKLVGFRGYRPDDYLIWFAWMVYTNVSVIAHVFIINAEGKHTSLLTPEDRENMPPEEYEDWIFGSKIFLVGFYSYAVIVWTLKFNMIFFYRRLVKGLWVERAIWPAMGLVASTAIAVALTFTLTCIPFHKLWQVYPDPKGLCQPQNEVTFYAVLVMNLVTDVCIFLIPIPVVLPMKTSVLRKIGLCMLFGLGLFCMIAAILRVVLVLYFGQSGVSAMWSIREDFVAIFVGQAPMVFPITKSKFWKGVYRNGYDSKTSDSGYNSHKMKGLSNQKPKDPYSITELAVTVIDKSESQEQIVKEDDESSRTKGGQGEWNHGGESSRSRSEHGSEQYHGRTF